MTAASRAPVTAPRGTERAVNATLIAAIHGGDLSGLGILFDRYGNDVRRLLLRLGIPAGDADDLVQQTFLDVLGASARFQADAPVKPWLLGLAAMHARRHRRSVSRMIARVQAWTRDAAHSDDHPMTLTPERKLVLSVEAARAQRALLRLSAKKREVFVLVALEGMSGAEAAHALRIPVATVWTRLHHARLELRTALAKEGV
jgi:RNA polymerase sigma factor (sigma-70 family)